LKIKPETSSASTFQIQMRDNFNTANVGGGPISFIAGSSTSVIRATWINTVGTNGYHVQVLPSGSASATFYHFYSLTVYVKVGTTLTPIFQNFVDLARSNKQIKYFYSSTNKTASIIYR